MDFFPAKKEDEKKGFFSSTANVIFVIITFHFVAFCWIFFRAKDFDIALTVMNNIAELQFDWHKWQTIIEGYRNVFLLMAIGFVWHFFSGGECRAGSFIFKAPSFERCVAGGLMRASQWN